MIVGDDACYAFSYNEAILTNPNGLRDFRVFKRIFRDILLENRLEMMTIIILEMMIVRVNRRQKPNHIPFRFS